MTSYYIYILECADGSLYTGIAINLEKRIKEHNESSKGAKYTQGRRPVKLAYSQKFKDRSMAAKEEARIKKLSRQDKLVLIASHRQT